MFLMKQIKVNEHQLLPSFLPSYTAFNEINFNGFLRLPKSLFANIFKSSRISRSRETNFTNFVFTCIPILAITIQIIQGGRVNQNVTFHFFVHFLTKFHRKKLKFSVKWKLSRHTGGGGMTHWGGVCLK